MRMNDAVGGPVVRRVREPVVSHEWLTRDDGPSLEMLVCRPSEAGGGAPVLFVHGACLGAWCWRESWLPAVGMTGRLAAAVSLRGHGESEGRDRLAWTGLPDLLADLTLAIRAMPAPPIIVGHSLGGLLAQLLLSEVATGGLSIRGLVLAGSLPPEGLALIGPWLGLRTLIEAIAEPDRSWLSTRLSAMFGDGIDPAARMAYAGHMAEGAMLALAQAHVPQPILPAYIVGVPVLVLHGHDDRLVGIVDAWRTTLYHAGRHVSLHRAGHCPMLGSRAGAGADVLCAWLARVG